MKDEEMDSRMRVLRVGCCDETSRPKAGIKSVQRKGRKGTQRGAKTCEFAESRVLSAAFPGHCAPSTEHLPFFILPPSSLILAFPPLALRHLGRVTIAESDPGNAAEAPAGQSIAARNRRAPRRGSENRMAARTAAADFSRSVAIAAMNRTLVLNVVGLTPALLAHA